MRNPGNVIDVPCESGAISAAVNLACSPEFMRQVKSLRNIYGDGNAARTIVERLSSMSLDKSLMIKKFHDRVSDELPQAAAS